MRAPCPLARLTPWMRRLMNVRQWILMWVLGMSCAGPAYGGLKFEFDYEYDTFGFFTDPARRESLEAAGRFVNRYVDNLDEIIPSGTNTWTSFFTPPDRDSSIFLSNVPVPEDTMRIYVAGRPLSGRLAQSIDMGPVGFGEPSWVDTVEYRGQTAAGNTPARDFGPMGGTISFNNNFTEVPWHFDASTTGLNANEFDFITVAMHELLHLMGVGISTSFDAYVTNNHRFTGPESVAVGSPTNPTLTLDESDAHWKSGTKSTWNGAVQEALLAPGIFPGRRANPTLLDRAALRDIGWEEAGAGDANLDGQFNSSDFLTVFQAGKYETGEFAGWAEGDWNDNAKFESGDLIEALQTGTYELPPAIAAIPWASGSLPAASASYDELMTDLTVDGAPSGGGGLHSVPSQVVPEPGSLGLAFSGALLLSGLRRGRRQFVSN